MGAVSVVSADLVLPLASFVLSHIRGTSTLKYMFRPRSHHRIKQSYPNTRKPCNRFNLNHRVHTTRTILLLEPACHKCLIKKKCTPCTRRSVGGNSYKSSVTNVAWSRKKRTDSATKTKLARRLQQSKASKQVSQKANAYLTHVSVFAPRTVFIPEANISLFATK